MREAAAIGIDLAWSDRNLSGCVAVDSKGRVVDERLLAADDDIVEWVAALADEHATVAIDAPLLVANETGRRPCENEVARVYGSRHAAPHSSNRRRLIGSHGRIRGEDLAARLGELGFGDPWSDSQRVVLEVYPHPAIVEVFGLDRRLKYKKGNVAERRAGLRTLEGLIAELASAMPSLHAPRLDITESTGGASLKGIEDLLDARICAWIARLWQHDPERVTIYGDSTYGHIAVPSGSNVEASEPDSANPSLISTPLGSSDLSRDEERFEIAVGNFMRSCIDLQANEATFQAWYATAVVAEFGLARVYRETHVTRDGLVEIAPNAIRLPDLTEKGNEFFPDLSVSKIPAIDARHTATRDPALQHAGVMLNQFSIVTEFKATGSTTKPTTPKAIRADLSKLAVFAEAYSAAALDGDRSLATYMVILDNFEKYGKRKPHYGPKRMLGILTEMVERWPVGVSIPTVLVGSRADSGIEIATYRDFVRYRGS